MALIIHFNNLGAEFEDELFVNFSVSLITLVDDQFNYYCH